MFRAIGGHVPKSEKKITDIREFGEAWNQGLVDWGCAERILEEVDNYYEVDNYEPEEEKKANNDIAESQLTGIQYKLTQGNGK